MDTRRLDRCARPGRPNRRFSRCYRAFSVISAVTHGRSRLFGFRQRDRRSLGQRRYGAAVLAGPAGRWIASRSSVAGPTSLRI